MKRFAFVGAVLATLTGLVLGACSQDEGQNGAETRRDERRSTEVAHLAPHPFSFSRLERATFRTPEELAPGPIALDPGHVVWLVGSYEGETGPDLVVERDLATGRTRTLDTNVNRGYGVASTTDWVVYGKDTPAGPVELRAIRHDRSDQFALSPNLVTSVVGRGELVAWGEEKGSLQRVVVRDMARAVEWIAAELPRCAAAGCYRLDAVTLAAGGVVFARGAIGPHPSVVGRRGFSDSGAVTVDIPGDPQPDLVPSSFGAAYYAFRRGWFQWDFALETPRRVRPSISGSTLIELDGEITFELLHDGCRVRIFAQIDRRRPAPVTTPEAVIASSGVSKAETCVEFRGLVWTGTQAVTAWTLISPETSEAHEDEGVVGITIVGAPLVR